MANTILRLKAVKTRTGLSRSTIYLRIAHDKFPTPVSLGGRAVGWVEAEIEAWVASQIARSRRPIMEQSARSANLPVNAE
jgi:prophage regulatory protein